MRLRANPRRLIDAGRERGAVLALTAMTIIIVMASGALAVDLSALETQGQTLQNTADAAALAGVAAWAESYEREHTVAVVEDVIRQNGIEIGDEIELTVGFPSPMEVQVTLSDSRPDVFLAGAIGLGDELVRDASARLRVCEDSCHRTVDINEPFRAFRASGAGDGFLPVGVGHRVYSLNRLSNTINCVDRTTNEECWPQRTLYPFDADPVTMSITHTYVVGSRIFYLSWTGPGIETAEKDPHSFLQLSCWETVTDTPCAETRFIRNAGQGTLIGTPDGLYVMAANLHVHCFLPTNIEERCPGYGGGGRVMELRKEGRGFDQYWANRLTNGDYVIIGDRFYYTAAQDTGQVWLGCWEGRKECRGFDAPPINDTGTTDETRDDFSGGRLFVYRNRAGEPLAVCSLGYRVKVECLDPVTSERDGGAEAAMSVTTDRVEVNGSFIGTMTYHEETNRLFFVSDHETSTTYCHDFSTGSFCGERYNTSTFGPTQPYGYLPEENCLVGLGEPQIFFTLRPDMSGECTNGQLTIDIAPCLCAGEVVWPPISAWNLDGVDTFEARILDPEGNVIMPDYDGWFEVGLEPIDLTGLGEYDYITVEVNVEGDFGEDPWLDDEPPQLVIGVGDLDPQLVE